MNTSMQVAQSVGEVVSDELKQVRAGINEQAFFASLKHLFSNPFSILGELMQNARRAGATQVDFFVDAEAKRLTVLDNGCGIGDFQLLIHLCSSGWDDNIQATDKPFGMGLFAAFFACEAVTFRSKGKKLVVTLDDITNKRALAEEADVDDDAPKHGTRIHLEGLTPEMMRTKQHGFAGALLESLQLSTEIEARAKGFPVPVFLNGEELERPFAREKLIGEEIGIGFVSIPGVHFDQEKSGLILPHYLSSHVNYFLQGLPIGMTGGAPMPTVHLDSKQFVARMPDRTELYDDTEQHQVIRACLFARMQKFLSDAKQRLDGPSFIANYWLACKAYDCADLLCDMPWVPVSLFTLIDSVAFSSDDGTSSFFGRRAGSVISREEIRNGSVKVWRNAPKSTYYEVTDDPDEVGSAALLRVMVDENIVTVADAVLPAGHWLFEDTPDASAFEVTGKVEGAGAAESAYVGNANVRVQLAEAVVVTITTDRDPAFFKEVRIADGWVILSRDAETEGPAQACAAPLTVYIMDEGVDCGHPVTAFENFLDEYDHYDQAWHDREREAWNSLVEALRGGHIVGAIRRAVIEAPFRPGPDQAKQMAVVSCYQDRDWQDKLQDKLSLEVTAVDETFWAKVAETLASLEQSNPELAVASRLRQAFEAVSKAGWVKPAKEADAS